MNERARAVWAKTRLHVWPDRYVLASLPLEDVEEATSLAAVRLGEAGVSIIPQCAYLKDHVLVHEADLATAIGVIEALIRESA